MFHCMRIIRSLLIQTPRLACRLRRSPDTAVLQD
jgi:hypothetical protein